MSDWDKDRKEYRQGAHAVIEESRWTLWKTFTRVILPLIAVLGLLSLALGWFGEGCRVTKDEYGPKAALKKYEWFKDQASRIDKMDADIALYRARAERVETQYIDTYGSDRKSWPPVTQLQYRESFSQALDDLAAIVSQRNNLVREYNAQSETFNWSGYNLTGEPKPRYEALSP
jgi:hypothetical protein